MTSTIKFKRKDYFGNVWLHTCPGVSTWADETSPHDPYTMRVMRGTDGRLLGGPIVGEFFDWSETPDNSELARG